MIASTATALKGVSRTVPSPPPPQEAVAVSAAPLCLCVPPRPLCTRFVILREKPLIVHALAWTIEALRQHIFNWVIWPDFTEIPHYERPWMKFEPLAVGQEVILEGKTYDEKFRSIRALTASHTVPAIGFELKSPASSLVFSGDTGPNDEFWRQVNGIKNLKYLIIESAFPNRDQDLAMTAKHLFPIQLANELTKLRIEPKVYVTHLKPSDVTTTEREIKAWVAFPQPTILEQGLVLEF